MKNQEHSLFEDEEEKPFIDKSEVNQTGPEQKNSLEIEELQDDNDESPDKQFESVEQHKRQLSMSFKKPPDTTGSLDQLDPLRNIEINNLHDNQKLYCGNQIRTSKYTVLTFLPKNLIDQFSKLANIYFLIMMILQIIPDISNSNGQPTILVPLLFVIMVSGAKDIFEDMKRHKADNVENSRPVIRSSPSKLITEQRKYFVDDQWKNLKVGEIVLIKSDEFFPADLVLIKSSNNNGLCYVETKNLDGETNLKHKQAVKDIQAAVTNPDQASNLRGKVICEPPNDHLYKFEGTITYEGQTYALDHNQLLLRGTSLKNTEWIYGLVVYTGHDTRIMKNSSKQRTKFSRLEVQTNKQIILIFIFQVLICAGGAGLSVLWIQTNFLSTQPYLQIEQFKSKELMQDTLIVFGTWMLSFSNFVPISLIVTMEMVKFMQAYFIQWDVNIYDQSIDMPTKVQSSNLNEQLGQVEYVFSDKTGTLTCNKMEFKKMSIGNYAYGSDELNCSDQKEKDVSNFNMIDKELEKHIKDKNHENHQLIDRMLFHLAACHTVVVDQKEGKQFYNASSPDELALVNGAKYYDFKFVGRDEDNNIEILINGQIEKVQLLNVIEFTSQRKRMTVIVKLPDERIMVLCKGADSIILPRLKENDQQNKKIISFTKNFLESSAKLGLRTLLLCEKQISQQDYERWLQEYKAAAQTLGKRDEAMESVADSLEQEFTLIGATAIEDKLQDEVDKAIMAMKKGGIKVWVLTGDKIETAINIGFSCKLLNDEMELYIIDGQDKTECLSQIAECRKLQINSEGLRKSGTVVSGESLFKIMASPRLTKQFLKLATSSTVLIACRMSPKQKADVVKMVQQHSPKSITLAIGDGANDVNMITAAHIGVGISGLEGQQAVSSSDYAIGQFKYLKDLLMVHGRESYRRNSYLVCYTFYKNVLFIMPEFWFGFYSGWSGQVFYEQWIYQIFNLVFTAFPIGIFALFDWQYPRQEFMRNSKLYQIGIKGQCFSYTIFWKWIFYAILQSLLIFFVSFFAFTETMADENGKTGDMLMEGMYAYGAIVILCNIQILYDSNTHSFISFWFIVLSVSSYFAMYWLMNLFSFFETFDYFNETTTFPLFHMSNLFFALMPIPIESFFFFVKKYYTEEKEKIEEQRKVKEKKRFTRGLDKNKLAPIKKHCGFAFSGESGHAPQITDKLLRQSTRQIMAAQRVIQAMKTV